MEKNIKKAVESAKQEIQEKEIAQLKSIIKDLLEKKVKKEEEKREVEKEISVIKQTIDDFKAGRLDKVKELQEKDKVAERLLPFKIVIINQPVITQPWGWSYQVVPSYNPINTFVGYPQSYDLIGTTSFMTTCASTTGNNYATFATGTYSLTDGRIINL